jgi:hypothetical protein
LLRFQDHTQTHKNRSDSSGQEIGPSQGPLSGNTQQSQKTDIHEPGGIQNPKPQQASSRRPTPKAARPGNQHSYVTLFLY